MTNIRRSGNLTVFRGARRASAVLVGAACLAVPAVSRAADPANTTPLRVTITSYSIDPDADGGFFSDLPDPYFVIRGGGRDQRVTPPQCGGFAEGCIFQPNTPVTLPADTYFADVPVPLGVTAVPISLFLRDDDNFLRGDDDREFLTDHDGANILVDLKTGLYTGDVNSPNNCATRGPNMICFTITSGFGDADGDGLLDTWETNGLDINGHHLDLPGMGARPDHKDLFVELDWVPGFEPTKEVIDEVKKSFALAPAGATGTPNPDGTPGINIHIDTGTLTQKVGGVDVFVGDPLGGGEELPAPDPNWCGFEGGPNGTKGPFVTTRDLHFDPDRKGIFRYAISKDGGCPMCGPGSLAKAAGCGGGGNLVVQLVLTEKKAFNAGEVAAGRPAKWDEHALIFRDAAVLMHEIGHTLHLNHGGFESHNCKPNYLSIMNYFYSSGIPSGILDPLVDFAHMRTNAGVADSRINLGSFNETAMNETVALNTDGSAAFRQITFTDGKGTLQTRSIYSTPIDWDGDLSTTLASVSVNVDADPTSGTFAGVFTDCDGTDNTAVSTELKTNDDWTFLKIPFDINTQLNADVGPLPRDGEPNDSVFQALAGVSQCAPSPTSKYVTQLPNGDMKYSITFPARQAYVEAFVRQNGVQNISGNIVGSQVANSNGTFTYSRTVPASQHHAGDMLGARFYSYVSGGPQVFTPGPAEQVWLPDFVYGMGPECLAPTKCHPYITRRADGSLAFTVTFATPQAYAEAFVRRNGVQIASGNIVQSGVTNADGTYSYKRIIPASTFVAGDQITVRFYSYVAGGPQVFTPGPSATVWSQTFTYGQLQSLDPMCQVIVSASCTDKIQNQNETGIDCGGLCPACAVPVALPIASATAGGAAAQPASNAVDGNTSTRYASNGALNTASISFNLAPSNPVASKLRLLMYQGSSVTYPLKIMVGSSVVFMGQTTTGSSYWDLSFPPTAGKVVTVTMTGANSANNNTLSIFEAQVLGK